MKKKPLVISKNERWLHTPKVREALDRAFAWAATHTPSESNLDEIEKKMRRELNSRSGSRPSRGTTT